MVAAAGILSLLLLWADVFLTVFHPEGRGGPVAARLNRLVWSAARRVSRRRDGTVRARALAFAGPLMPVLTLATWMGMLIGGFALVYYPWIGTFLVSPGQLRGRALEALSFSGYTATTLGLGDVVPDAPGLRLLTVLEALSGFSLVTVAITYLLAVYRELLEMQTLAATVAAYFRDGERETLEMARASGFEPLARWSENVTTSLLQVHRAHFQYPIVHYFRPPDETLAMPVQLGPLLAVRRWAGGGTGAEAVAELTRHPSARALQAAVETYLRDVESHFIPEHFEPHPGNADPTERAYARLRSYMMYPCEGGEAGRGPAPRVSSGRDTPEQRNR